MSIKVDMATNVITQNIMSIVEKSMVSFKPIPLERSLSIGIVTRGKESMKYEAIGKRKLISSIALPLVSPQFIHKHWMIKDSQYNYNIEYERIDIF